MLAFLPLRLWPGHVIVCRPVGPAIIPKLPKKVGSTDEKLDEKAGRLLAADLEERPFATLQERRDYVEAITGLSVSRSTVCRAIARRIGSTRKKGGARQPSATSS